MILSIVTGTLDRQQSLYQFVTSVVEHTTLPYELLISNAGHAPLSKGMPDQVRVIAEKPRKGYVAGYNAMFKECAGEFVVWMNDDAEVTPGWDVAAVNFMNAHPEIGLGCLPFRDPGESDFTVRDLWNMAYANFGIIKRELGEKIGWFDSDLTMYGSDNAITFKVLLHGLGVSPIPGANVIHHRVRDNQRYTNQHSRPQDARILTDRYKPHMRKMLKTFWTLLPESCW